MTKNYKKLVDRIIIQAVKDYAEPTKALKDLLKSLNKDQEDYHVTLKNIKKKYRKSVLKDLRSNKMVFWSEGRSAIIADKLEKANLRELKARVRREEALLDKES